MAAAEGHSRALRANRAAGEAVPDRQSAARIQLNVALARGEVAEVHPDARLAGDQADTVRIHPAERAGIHRHHGRGALAGNRPDAAVGAHAVRPCGHRQVVRMYRGVHFRRARNNRQRVALAGVQPLAFNRDGPFRHLQRQQVTAGVKLRLAGGQGDVRGVDKSAPVTGNAVGVGHHDVCRLTGDFRVALQLRAAGARDFVDDAFRFPPGLQVGVVLNKPAQLGPG